MGHHRYSSLNQCCAGDILETVLVDITDAMEIDAEELIEGDFQYVQNILCWGEMRYRSVSLDEALTRTAGGRGERA